MPDPPSQHAYDLTSPGHISPSQRHAPRISVAIFRAAAGKIPELQTTLETDLATNPGFTKLDFSDPASFDSSLKLQLRHIFERLQRGLEEAWRSDSGYDGVPDPSPEEEWARLFSEQVVFSAYGGVKYSYNTDNMGDDTTHRYEMCFMARACHDDDPAFPTTMACQHLSTLCLLTRGYEISDVCNLKASEDAHSPGSPSAPITAGILITLKDIKQIKGNVSGCAAGDNSSMPLFGASAGKAKWITVGKSTLVGGVKKNTESGDHRKFESLITLDKLTPGSILGFNPQGPNPDKQLDGSHVGSVLRLGISPPQFTMQGIDTGPLGGGSGDTVTVDHNFQNSAFLGTLPGFLVGVGVLPATPPSAAALDRLRRTRPVALVRLVLFDTSNQARFISSLMPAHHKDQGFPVSKLVWALRDLPAGALRGLWLVSSPWDAGARAALDPAMRTGPIADSFKAAGIDFTKASHTTFSTDRHVITNQSDSVVALFRFKSLIHGGLPVVQWEDQTGQKKSEPGDKGTQVHTPVVGSIKAGTKPKATVATFLRKFAAAESCIWRDSGSDEHVSAADLLADMEYFGGGAAPDIEAAKTVEDEPAGPSSGLEPAGPSSGPEPAT